MSKQRMIGVRVEPELYARVVACAERDGRSITNFVRWHLAAICGAEQTLKRRRNKNPDSLPQS